jgi:acyl dehydratase
MQTSDLKSVSVPWIEVPSLAGQEFVGEWLSVGADRLHHFDIASYTDENANTMDPNFYPGGLIEGFHLLALLDHLVNAVLFVEDPLWAGWNYGLDRVRFVSPITTEDALRVRGEVITVEPRGNGFLVLIHCTLDVQGRDKPGVTAEWRVLWTRTEDSE